MTINWFDEHFEVPLGFGITITIIIILLVLVPVLIYLSKTIYVCDKCGCRFRLKWYKCMFSIHMNDDRYLKCPKCKKKSWCSPSYNQNGNNIDIDK